MSRKTIDLEILSGPLDGYIVLLEGKTEWTRDEDTPLSFPWDNELGAPQAHIFLEAENWWLEAFPAPHGTYCVGKTIRNTEKFKLDQGYIIKASETWMLIDQIG